MSNAREVLAMRHLLQAWLEPDEVRAVAWGVLVNAAADAVARGWTGDELARWCLAEVGGNPPDSVGAVMLTTIRALAQTDPPRDITPTPPHISHLRRDMAAAAEVARNVDHKSWVDRIKRRNLEP